MPLKQKHKNHLFLIRKKNALEQKQVALLLGHKTTDQISRYERGARLPNLKTALKLQIIYRLPIETLLHGYHEKCLDEIKNQSEISGGKINLIADSTDREICTYAELLKPLQINPSDMEKIGKHILELMNARTEKLAHR